MILYPRFDEFSQEEKCLQGPKVKIQDIVNQEIIITGFRIKQSKYQQESGQSRSYLALEIEQSGKKKVVFTGSSVLIDQINRYQNNIPFITTIRHIDKYYTFT